jgi:H+/Cl- antiporter ClcA
MSTIDEVRSRPPLAVRFGLAVAFTGVGAGVGGAALTLLLHLVQHFAFGYTENTFLIGVERASDTRRILVMTGAGFVAGAGWWTLRRYAARVPRVHDALRDETVRMPLLPVALDAALQIVVVALGASLGREGAPRQMGAALGAWIAEHTGLHADQRRILLACGAGGGLAAVYNVPLGGALFTLEVLLVSLRFRAIVCAFATSVIATAVAWTVLPNRPTYTVLPASLSGTIVVWSVLAAPLLAVAGLGFMRLTTWAARHRPPGWRLPVSTVVVFSLLGVLSVAYPQLLGNGKGPAQIAFDGRLSWATLVALVLLKPLVTAACLRSGAVGGRLTPAVATGALLGAGMGKAWLLLWPGARVGHFAIVAAAAFVAVTLKAPVTALVLVFEFTHAGFALLLPMVLAVGIATVVARGLEPHPKDKTDRQIDAVTGG